jgi:hypothetical protein
LEELLENFWLEEFLYFGLLSFGTRWIQVYSCGEKKKNFKNLSEKRLKVALRSGHMNAMQLRVRLAFMCHDLKNVEKY